MGMLRAAVVMLLVPGVALGQAPTKTELAPSELSTPQLLEQHETLESGKPGLLPPLVVAGVGLGSLVVGVAVASRVDDGPSKLNPAELAALSMMVVGAAVALVGAGWLLVNAIRRATYSEQLVTVRAELDDRDARQSAIPEPELLALLAAPLEAPKTGALLVMVTDARGPVAGAKVVAAGSEHVCDDRGSVALEGLAPGPVMLSVSAADHSPAEEAAAVVAGTRTAVRLTLAAPLEKLPARLTGLVRSSDSGKPVPAELWVAEAKAKVPVDAQGMFRVDVPPGSYSVTISAPGYLEQKKKVNVAAGDRAIFNVDLHPR